MSDEILKRDENHITVLAGITDDSNEYISMLRVDPTTKRLLVSTSSDPSAIYPRNVYESASSTYTTATVYTITHSLGITQAEMESGMYKVVITGSRGGFGYQFGDTYGSFWGTDAAGVYPAVRHQWTASDPGDIGTVTWQTNTLKFLVGGTTLTTARAIITKMFA